MSIDMSFDRLRPRTTARLIPAERLKSERYAGVVSVPVADDLVQIFCADLSDQLDLGDGKSATFIFNEKYLSSCFVTVQDLVSAAKDNAHFVATTLSSILGAYAQETATQMIIVTTNDGAYGAAAILDPSIQQRIYQMLGCKDFFILGSSIHECICVAQDTTDPANLADMVRTINRSDVVMDEDILSDHVYALKDGNLIIVA